MRRYVTIRGRRIAVHAQTDAQLRWYRINYSRRTDAELDVMARDTDKMERHETAHIRRASLRVV